MRQFITSTFFLQKYTVTYIAALIHLAEDFIPTCFVFIEMTQPHSPPPFWYASCSKAHRMFACLVNPQRKTIEKKTLYTSLSEKRAAAETWTGFATYKKTKFEKS